MVAEILEGYLSYRRVPPLSVGSQAQARLPSSEHQRQEEVPTQHLAVKIGRVSVLQGEVGVH